LAESKDGFHEQPWGGVAPSSGHPGNSVNLKQCLEKEFGESRKTDFFFYKSIWYWYYFTDVRKGQIQP
jgi:hypothetical protein